MDATLYVCTTCRAGLPLTDDEATPGEQLYAALLADPPPGVRVKGVACLSACDQGCSIALARSGGWTYVYGRLTPDDAPDIRAGASAYAKAADGLVPWRERPQIFRKQSLARIPPMEP